MNSKVLNGIFFLVGAAIGSAVTYEVIKSKYESVAQEEINEMKEVYNKRMEELDEKTHEVSSALSKFKDSNSVINYAKIIKENEYNNELSDIIDDDDYEEEDEESEYDEDQFIEYPDYSDRIERERPYVIDPEIFGEYFDYDTIELTYYADLVVANEDNEIVDDVNDLIGIESLGHFGEYEEDAVHVRNDKIKADFEILKDERKYVDVLKTLPPRI